MTVSSPPMAQHFDLVLPRGRQLRLPTPASGGRPLLMGILNITPDSFSDGGRWMEPERAIARGLEILDEGADLLDLGAESTRPGGGVYGDGAPELSPTEELDRLLPVLQGLRRATDAPLSVDTRKGAVAEEALRHGADLINDVSGLQDDALTAAVAAAGCPVIIMHSRGELPTMQRHIHFEDVVSEVAEELAADGRRAVEAGIETSQIVYDPGIGFGKTARQNLLLLKHCDLLNRLGRPLLIGASRKSFIATVRPAPPSQRLGGSLAALAWATRLGAAIVRAHDIEQSRQFLEVWNAIDSASAVDAGRPTSIPT